VTDAADQPAAVALFGTSADPPTLGHRTLLEGLTHHYPLVRTWASDNPFKTHGAPLAVRAALLNAVVAGLDRPSLRLDQSLSSPRAVETLQRAARQWPGSELVFVVGSDLLPQIQRWYAAQEILQRCRLAVVPRLGWPLDALQIENLCRQGARVEVLPLEIPATASSAIRRHPDPQLVPPELWPVLLEQNLYGLRSCQAGRPPVR
jgi:nicotinate-nucleotide adenylyltransferase